jgi:hypothetical protein
VVTPEIKGAGTKKLPLISWRYFFKNSQTQMLLIGFPVTNVKGIGLGIRVPQNPEGITSDIRQYL